MTNTRDNSHFVIATLSEFMRVWDLGEDASLHLETAKGHVTMAFTCKLGPPSAPHPNPTFPPPPAPAAKPRHRGPAQREKNRQRAALYQATKVAQKAAAPATTSSSLPSPTSASVVSTTLSLITAPVITGSTTSPVTTSVPVVASSPSLITHATDSASSEEAVVQKDAVESLLYSCCFCKLSNKTSRALRMHKELCHKKELRECERHEETTGQYATSTKHYCEKCKLFLENSEILREHNREKHRIFDCEVCAFSSSSENGLNIHITKAHSKFQENGKVCEIEQRSNESWYLCNICDNPCNAFAFVCKHPWKMSDHFKEQHSYMSEEISQEQKIFLKKLDKTVLPGWAPR